MASCWQDPSKSADEAESLSLGATREMLSSAWRPPVIFIGSGDLPIPDFDGTLRYWNVRNRPDAGTHGFRDSYPRCQHPADLQSAAIVHSATPPKSPANPDRGAGAGTRI